MKFETNVIEESFAVKGAVLLYSKVASKGYYGTSNSVQKFATLHEVHMTQHGRPVIGVGRPLNDTDYLDMVKSLKPEDRPELQWMEPSILAKGADKMLWWTPPGKRAMFFKESSHGKKTFTGQSICPLPGLVWLSSGSQLYIYAVKGNARPAKETQLCQAPLFNVWSSGQVCQGNVYFPDEATRNMPSAWEDALFKSRFTHPNFGEKDRLVKGVDPVDFWKRMVKKPTAEFPQSRLVELNLKCGDLLDAEIESKLRQITARGEF